MGLNLKVLPGAFAVCRLPAGKTLPPWALSGPFSSVTQTQEELSVVCLESAVPVGVRSEGGWRGLQVVGPLDFALTGILCSLAAPLAEAGISIFAISTFDTDYLLVKAVDLAAAVDALRQAGHHVAHAA